jgi:hypothetical protein
LNAPLRLAVVEETGTDPGRAEKCVEEPTAPAAGMGIDKRPAHCTRGAVSSTKRNAIEAALIRRLSAVCQQTARNRRR